MYVQLITGIEFADVTENESHTPNLNAIVLARIVMFE